MIDYLPIEITDPSHDYNNSLNHSKPHIINLFQGCFNNSPCWLLLDNFDLLAANSEFSEFAQILGEKIYSKPLENLRSLFLTLLDKANENVRMKKRLFANY